MYRTAQEAHIALDLGLQHIDSNRKQSISPDHKDMALNAAVLQFIENRTSFKSNRKGEGFEDSVKRYDDVRELKTSYKSNVWIEDDKPFILLPVNYYKFVSAGGSVKFSKFNLPTANMDVTKNIQIITFPDDYNQGVTYENFKLVQGSVSLFDIKDYTTMPKLYTYSSKFILINLIMDVVNRKPNVEIYWEKWNNEYHPNSFIVSTNSNNLITLSYGSVSVNSKLETRKFTTYSNVYASLKPIDLISSSDKYTVQSNYHLYTNRHLNPLGYMEDGRFYVLEGNNFVIGDVTIDYIRKPRLINHRTGQSCELTVTREIVDIAIQRLKAFIKDEGYQAFVMENQIIE
jgi:hypothetical protein